MSIARRQQLLGYPKLAKPSIHAEESRVEKEPHLVLGQPSFQVKTSPAQTLQQIPQGVDEENKMECVMKDAQIQSEKAIEAQEPQMCNECGKQFSKKSNLKRHHQTEHCERVYKYLRHKKLNERYKCQLCKRTYSHTFNLKNHILKHHGGAIIGGREVSSQSIVPRKQIQERALSHERDTKAHPGFSINALMTQFDERTRCFLKDFKFKIPLVINILMEEPMQSPYDIDQDDEIDVRMIDLEVVKVYPMKSLLNGMTYQNRLLTEIAVSRLAAINKANYVIHLEQLYLAVDHVALKFRRYEEDLRDYLRLRRNPEQLNEIFINILRGMRELHAMGFIHRDLKPDNVVIQFEPLTIVLIDFNRSLLDTTASEGTVLGTQGYFPMASKWRDGSIKWDVWAYAAMVLEADMPPDAYLHTKDEKQAKQKFHQHSLHPHTSQALRDLVSKIFFAKRDEPLLTYDEIENLVTRIKFRQY